MAKTPSSQCMGPGFIPGLLTRSCRPQLRPGTAKKKKKNSSPTREIRRAFRMCLAVQRSCPTLCDPMNCSTPGLPVHHQLRESTQTHAHRVGDAIPPSHPLSSPSPPAFHLSQHQLHTAVRHMLFLHLRCVSYYPEVRHKNPT